MDRESAERLGPSWELARARLVITLALPTLSASSSSSYFSKAVIMAHLALPVLLGVNPLTSMDSKLFKILQDLNYRLKIFLLQHKYLGFMLHASI